MKQPVNAFDYAGHICKALSKGILITAKAGETVNPMVIGWGTIGVEWGKPVFVAYVRHCRYTWELLEKNPEFTVNIPLDGVDPEIIKVCGTKSGRDIDKVAALGLTLSESDCISVPGIKELPLTLECKIIEKEDQNIPSLLKALRDRYYPEDVTDLRAGCNPEIHTAFYGEILNAYIIE